MNLTFKRDKEIEESYWSCFLKFEPTNTPIELILFNNESGYEKEQLSWFYEIEVV